MIPRAMLAVAYATGRASHARQVKGDDPDKKGYTGPPGWGLDVRLTTPPQKKILLRNRKRRPRPTQGCRADDDDDNDYHQFRNSVYYKNVERSCFQCKGCIVLNALRV
jgi:hypothetical protein